MWFGGLLGKNFPKNNSKETEENLTLGVGWELGLKKLGRQRVCSYHSEYAELSTGEISLESFTLRREDRKNA